VTPERTDPLSTSEPPDAVLLARLAEGDREAFADLFRRYQATIHRFARQMTGAKEDAEDVTQEVFLVFAEQHRRFDPALGSLGTYLYGIARNLVRRRRRQWKALTDPATLEETGSPAIAASSDPLDAIARAERIGTLRTAILRLPLRYREVLVLCALNGVSYDEAARIVGCPVGTVRSRLHRARQMLSARCQAADVSPGRTTRRLAWMSEPSPTVRSET
jgi:RNA polymerase sigma-70 factor (ECF subfamily)